MADAASIEEHINRSKGVTSDVRRDPWAAAPSNLADAVTFVCNYSSQPSVLLHRRHVVDGILGHIAMVLQPLTSELFMMAPPFFTSGSDMVANTVRSFVNTPSMHLHLVPIQFSAPFC